jgi:3-oxoacyl-[acyl-carrier-protein] synthase III
MSSWLDFSPLAETAATDRPRSAAAVLGLGAAVPATEVPNEVIAQRLGLADGWIERRTGIEARRHLADGETLTDLAIEAGRQALEEADVRPSEVDLVIAATTTADNVLPNMGPLVAAGLGAHNAGAFDVGAACTGFVYALGTAAGMLEARRARHALVVGADGLSRFLDHDDRVTAALFGDGAGAFLVGPGEGSIGPMTLGAEGGLGEVVWIPRETSKIVMDGHGTFVQAVKRLQEVTEQGVRAAGLRLSDIDLFVYHQANRRILHSLAERMGLPQDRVVDAIATVGNTSAASLPLALDQERRAGRLRPGAKVLLGAVGSGFTWGGGVVTW